MCSLGGVGVGGSIILKFDLKRRDDGRVWTGFVWPRRGCCEHGNELQSSITWRASWLAEQPQAFQEELSYFIRLFVVYAIDGV